MKHTRSKFRRPFVLLLGLSVLCGCGSDGSPESGGGDTQGPGPTSVLDRSCNKMDECNVLRGMSVSECKTAAQECMDELRPSQQEDLEKDIAFCLTKADCQEIWTCFEDASRAYPDFESCRGEKF